MSAKQRTEGWGRVGGTRKVHYFRGGRSLCRRWAAGTERPWWASIQSRGSSELVRDTCAACWSRAYQRGARA